LSKFRHISSLIFLTLFLSVKTLGLHVLSHDESHNDINQCELCHVPSSVNFEPFLYPKINPTFIQTFNFDKSNTEIKIAQLIYLQDNLVNLFLSRPPPNFL